MAKKKSKEDQEVAAAAKALGAPVREEKVKAWRDPTDGQLYCVEHQANAGDIPDLVDPKEGEVCATCAAKLLTGEEGTPAPARHVNRVEHDRQVTTALDGEERDLAVAELTAALDERDRLERDRKEVVAEWKGILASADERVEVARRHVKEGRLEVVRVMTVTDYDEGTVVVTRLDTGEEVERRLLTDDERQRTLDGLEDGDGTGAALELLDAVQGAQDAEDAAKDLEAHQEQEGGPHAGEGGPEGEE